MFTLKIFPKISTALVVLLFVTSFPLLAQTIIKDTVEIKPKLIQPNSSQAVTAEEWNIEVTIKWESRGGAPSRIIWDHYAGSTLGGRCGSGFKFFSGTNPFTFTVVNPRAGRYDFHVDTFEGIITQVIIRDTGFPDLVIDSLGRDFSYTTPYSSGVNFYGGASVKNINYENALLDVAGFTEYWNCSSATRFNSSVNPDVSYTIVQGAEYASLINYWDRTVYGDTYTKHFFDEPFLGLAANGKCPVSDTGALVVIEVRLGTITEFARLRVRPYHYRIKQPAGGIVVAGEETEIQVGLTDWLGRDYSRTKGAATQFMFADTGKYGTLSFSGVVYDPEAGRYVTVEMRGDTLNGIAVPIPTSGYDNILTFVWTKTSLKDTLPVPLLMKKTGDGIGGFAEYLWDLPYPGEDTVATEGKLTLIPGDVQFDHFEMKVQPDTIKHGDTGKIFVTAKDEGNEEYPLNDNTPLYFSLGFQGERLGNLKYGATEGRTLNDIPYSVAKSGSILYIANGENPTEPTQIGIGVSGADTVTVAYAWVKPMIEKFCQGDYADVKYDEFVKDKDLDGNPIYYSVSDKGCALTCMAMVGHAGGADIDPGKLAEYMNDPSHYGFNEEHGVIWNTTDDLTGNTGFEFDSAGGGGLKYKKVDGKRKVDLSKSTPIELSGLDSHLSDGALIIAQVYNQTSGNQHFVLLTEKEGEKYNILDPGCYSGRSDISAYNGKVYKFIIYRKK